MPFISCVISGKSLNCSEQLSTPYKALNYSHQNRVISFPLLCSLQNCLTLCQVTPLPRFVI